MAYIPKGKRSTTSERIVDDSKLKDIFSKLDKLNEDASVLADNTLSVVDEWIDTGSMALNAIFSGSLYKGIPRGRVTGFIGNPQTCKSMIVNKIAANAQKMGYYIAIWDTENSIDKNSALALGVDPNRVRYYPIQTVEDCRNQVVKLLNDVAAQKDPNIKILVIIDSLGNLSTKKEVEDIEGDKAAADMGGRAKAIKSLMRSLTYPSAKARVPILYTNHIYDNPGEMHPTMVKTQSGGKSSTYIGSLIVQLSTRNETIVKNEDEAKAGTAHGVSGITLSALTTKNRFIPPFQKAELYLNYRTGLSKFAGLRELAIGLGVVKLEGKTYSMNGESIGYASKWEKDPEFWTKAFPLIEDELQKQLCYNSTPELDALPLTGDGTPETDDEA